MNKDRILELATAIETHALSELGFNMDHWYEGPYEEGYAPVDRSGHNCNTIACIGGWTEALFNGGKLCDTYDETGELLGLDHKRADELFFGYSSAERVIEPADAARVLRHLAETGRVEWHILQEAV